MTLAGRFVRFPLAARVCRVYAFDMANKPTETAGLYWVNQWGSHPDFENDDCYTGHDFATEAEARAFLAAGVKDCFVAFLELDGPNVNEVHANRFYDEREVRRDRSYGDSERAMQAGMMGGCDAYNDEMGW